jgi:hypothetical protein
MPQLKPSSIFANPVLVRVIFAVVFIMSTACNSNAMWVTIERYMKEQNGNHMDFMVLWLDGVYDGLMAASALTAAENKGDLFCQPEKLVMTKDQIKSILDDFLAKHKMPPDMPINTVLLGALREVFPCG